MNNNINSDFNQKEISLEEIVFSLKKHIKIILFITFFCFFCTLIYVIIQKPRFESTSLILIEDPSASAMDIFDAGVKTNKNYIENEKEILKSRTIYEKSIRTLLESDVKNNLFIFGTREYNHPFNFIPSFLYKKPDYRYIDNTLDETEFLSAVKKLKDKTTIVNKNKTDIIKVTVNSIDPDESALLANTIVNVYQGTDLEWSTGEMTSLKSFLDSQITIKENELNISAQELKKFQEEEKIFSIDDNSSLLLTSLLNIESEYYKYKAEGNILKERISYIEDQLTSEEKKMVNNVTNTINNRLFALKNELALKETELISAISQQGEDHQIVKNIERKLESLKERLKLETRKLVSQGIAVADPINYRQSLMDSVISISAIYATIEAKSSEYEKLVNQYESQLVVLPEKLLEFSRLKRNLNIDTETYSLMRSKIEEAKINEASKISKVRVIDKANPDYERVTPKRKLSLLIGLIFGGILGVVAAFIIEILDGTIKSIEDIEKRGLTILALIPSIGLHDKKRKNKLKNSIDNAKKIQRRLITYEDPKSPVSESYRTLRTGLLYANSKKAGNVILVSSPGPGEGKTTTIVNLAITYANLGKKCVIIDTDLRKPVAHTIFDVKREPGITRFISGVDDKIDDLIHKTEIENLSLITCGVVPPNPSEVLASERMKNLVNHLKKKFDVIFFDAPPLLAVTDAFISLSYTDQFILVVRSSHTQKGGLDRAIELLNQSNAPLSGVVINDIDSSNSYGGGYYYNYYQYYYGSEK